jgi:hypothetical protein
MKMSRFTGAQILSVLKQAEGGIPANSGTTMCSLRPRAS